MADYPVNNPMFANLLVRKLVAEAVDKPDLEHAIKDTLLRHSDAGSCARKIGFKVAGYYPSDPIDGAGLWVMELGTLIHKAVQEVAIETWGEDFVIVEAEVGWEDLSASGHIDLVLKRWVECDDDNPRAAATIYPEDPGKSPYGLLVMDSGDPPLGIRSYGDWWSGVGNDPHAPAVVDAVRRGDSKGGGDRPSLSKEGLLQPRPPGTGDPQREHPPRSEQGLGSSEGSERRLQERSPSDARQRGIEGAVPALSQGFRARPSLLVTELKTMGGFGFDKSVGLNRKGYKLSPKGPEGPRASAKIQGALNAVACDADELRIGHISLEAVSKQLAEVVNWGDEDRILAEWSYTPEEFRPWAEAEKARMKWMLDILDKNVLPDRWAVDDEMDPIHLNPQDARPPWQCAYCSYRQICEYAGMGEPELPIPGGWRMK